MTAALLLIAMKSMLVAAVTLGILRLAARRSAAERSAIAHLGLCALLALPLANSFLPALSIDVPEHVALRVMQAPISVEPATAALPVPVASAAADAGFAHWADKFVLWAYLLPAVALLLFICAALLRLFKLRAHARAVVDPVWLGALARVQSRMGFTRSTALLSRKDISSPISWGLMRPTILLNEAVLAASGQAEAIIAHELAHVIRHDWAKLILARVATAAFWFNPLAWLLAREAHQLREEAADDAVLAADVAGPDYAALLIGIARFESRSFLSVVHGVAPSRSSLRRRITRVLDDRSLRAVPGKCGIAALTTAMLVMTAPLAALGFAPADSAIVVSTKPAGPPDIDLLAQQVALDQLPQTLRKTLDAECTGNGGTPGKSPDLFKIADLNGDGIAELVFDRINYECQGAAIGRNRYGTTLTVFMGGPSNSVTKVYSGIFYGSWVEYGRDGKPSLIVARAADCPQSGWQSCGQRIDFNGPAHGTAAR